MFIGTIYLLLIYIWIIQAFPTPQRDIIEVELTKYIKKYAECNILQGGTCFYTHDATSLTDDVVSRFTFIPKICANLLERKAGDLNSWNDTSTVNDIFLFFEKKENLFVKANILTNYTFWAPDTRIHFILCSQAHSKDFLFGVLHNIWHLKIYNFVFVIVDRKYEVYTFNNFLNRITRIVNSSRNFCAELFPDNIKNLRGVTVRVALFEKLPIVSWDARTSSFKGSDVEVMKFFARICNASLQILDCVDGNVAINSLRNNESDIVFIGILQVRYNVRKFYAIKK